MLKTSDFDYDLPEDRIAIRPTEERDGSRLLLYNDSVISDHCFTEITGLLPIGSMLVFNNSKVIPARIILPNENGAAIELFLLEPENGTIETALSSVKPSRWICLVGNKKRWKQDQILYGGIEEVRIKAGWADREKNLVELHWEEGISLASMLEKLGKVPLPPYLNREATTEDRQRYQTVYADVSGSVAAPTAGLHFTPHVMNSLDEAGIRREFLTLHVGAGTFLPVKTENALEHDMHSEQLVLRRETLRQLALHQGAVIPVGTTSMRSLETISWVATRLLLDGELVHEIDQNYPYSIKPGMPSVKEAIQALLAHMDSKGMERLHLKTSIFIRPGYPFRICSGLITNFHQPRSTLLMLVAALVGPDWKKIYEHALGGQYRFLSYGDSSLLLPGNQV